MTSIETQCIQAGYDAADGDPRVAPIVQSTTYQYQDPDTLAALFDLKAEGHIYTRISNPTNAVLEAKVASIEGGLGAVATSSGQSANLLAILAVAQAGDHILSRADLYGGTHTLFSVTLARLGIETTYLPDDVTAEQFAAAVRPTTRAVFGEVLPNPGLEVTDIAGLAELAHAHGLPLILDNSLATAALCRPLEHGADIVTYSATKYLDGHATSVGGVVVDKGTFAWSPERHPLLTAPDDAYHGLSWTETFGELAFLARVRAGLLRDIGCQLAPQNAFLINLGIETLALRMERHSANALAIARWLRERPEVAWVRYPGLEDFPTFDLTQRYLPHGASGVLTFGLQGDHERIRRFVRNLQVIAQVTHVADVRSCIIHPASTTHRQLSEEQQRAAGVTPDLVRLSVGIEHVDDLIADLAQALEA